MRTPVMFVVGALLGASAVAFGHRQNHGGSHVAATPGMPLAHTRNEFTIAIHGPLGEAVKLFGAEGERRWAGKDWNPQFVYPVPLREDVQGEVFTITRGGERQSTWINTALDASSGHVQYVYMVPGVLVTLIDIHVRPDGDGSKATIVYGRTALTREANSHVEQMGKSDASSGQHWETAINAALAKSVK